MKSDTVARYPPRDSVVQNWALRRFHSDSSHLASKKLVKELCYA